MERKTQRLVQTFEYKYFMTALPYGMENTKRMFMLEMGWIHMQVTKNHFCQLLNVEILPDLDL